MAPRGTARGVEPPELRLHLLARSPRGSCRPPCRCATRRSGRCRARAPCRPRRPRRGRRECRARRRRSARASCACPGRSRSRRRGSARPARVSSSDAFDASLTSPPPVKPEPWKKSDEADPAVRARRARGAGGGSRVRRTASRRTAQRARVAARASGPSRSCRPGRSAFDLAQADRDPCRAPRRCAPCAPRRRTASAARRSRGTRRSAACSSSRRGRAMRTWSQRYGPVAWMHAAREHDGRERRVGAAVEEDVDVHRRRGGRRASRRSGAGRSTDGAWSSRPCPRRGRRRS